ncbi:MAG TPA: hypothetical protein VFB58_00765 [Chloroflexota bacterium]|nr:hypothetical protein [Chloroflexota bacterium]
MTHRTAARLAWSLLGLAVPLAVLSVLARALAAPGGFLFRGADIVSLLMAMLQVALILLGALIVSRQPGNAIGWLFTGYGFAGVLAFFVADTYFQLAVSDHVPLPGAAYAAWFESVLTGPMIFGLFAVLFLIFPNGRPLSPRWRLVVGLAVIATIGATAGSGLAPGLLNNVSYTVRNPLGVPALKDVLGAVLSISFLLVLAAMVGGAVSLVLRFRRSRGDERQQLKWVAAATALAAVLLTSGPLFWSNVIPAPFDQLWGDVFLLAALIIPLSIGIAMLKYRLYEIDVIINRALVYGPLTLTIAAFYIGAVIALQALSRTLTGQHSDLAIAVATLAVAALFNPWRRRVQAFVDRRFYRRKYDAVQVLATLNARLRDEVDLDQLTSNLAIVVQETVQPSHLGLWLAPETNR